MTKTDINKYKEILEARQAELADVLRNREAITIEKSPDALDEVQNAAERELAIRNLDRESNLLRNVRAALRRIDDGTFGICVHCEEEISIKRSTLCRGLRTASRARSRPTALRKREANPLKSCWSNT